MIRATWTLGAFGICGALWMGCTSQAGYSTIQAKPVAPAARRLATFSMAGTPFGPLIVPMGHFLQPPPDVLRVPLVFDNQWVHVQATVNGQSGIFLLDTGVPTLLLNEARLSLGRVVDSTWMGGSAGDSNLVHVYHGITLAWGGMTLGDVGGVGTETGDLLGVIGLAQLAPFTAVFDYPDQQLVLYRNDATGHPPTAMPAPTATIPLRWTADDGLFAPITVGGRTFWLLLDTGSNQNGVSTAVARTLGAHIQQAEFQGDDTGSVPGPGGISVPMTYGRIDQLQLGPVVYDTLLTRVWDFTATGEHFDGFLGYDFFARRRIGINVRKMEMYLWGGPKA